MIKRIFSRFLDNLSQVKIRRASKGVFCWPRNRFEWNHYIGIKLIRPIAIFQRTMLKKSKVSLKFETYLFCEELINRKDETYPRDCQNIPKFFFRLANSHYFHLSTYIWRFSMVYTEGEERYRMVLKRRETEDNEFVMKIEPEIGMKKYSC